MVLHPEIHRKRPHSVIAVLNLPDQFIGGRGPEGYSKQTNDQEHKKETRGLTLTFTKEKVAPPAIPLRLLYGSGCGHATDFRGCARIRFRQV